MTVTIRPIRDHVLVYPNPEKTETAGGIIIPATASSTERSQTGVVVAVGPGKVNDRGELMPMSVKVGDVVVFGRAQKGSWPEVVLGDKVHIMMRDGVDVLGVVSDPTRS